MYSSNDLVIYLVSIETSTRHQKEKVQQEVTVLLKNLLVCASSIALIGDLKPQPCQSVGLIIGQRVYVTVSQKQKPECGDGVSRGAAG